jgi:hypothetical protein
MALTLRYVGARPYTEFLVYGVPYGFSRGMERTDIPDAWIEEHIRPSIEAGVTMWEIVDAGAKEKTEKMKQVVEAAAPEPSPAPEVVEEPEPVAEPAAEPETSDDGGFDQSMTRAQMMTWCSERGLSVSNTDTKASLTEKATAYLSGA